MNIRKKYKWTIFAGIVLLPFMINSVKAQNIVELENDLFSSVLEFHQNKAKIDSLNNELSAISNELDLLKLNREKNRVEILDIMSGSVAITNEIKSLTEKQNNLNEYISNNRKQLYLEYTTKLDSLKEQANESPSNYLDHQIFEITEKKLLVQPKLGILSIDPYKLLNVDIQSQESLSKIILMEYFQNALEEIDSHLAIIKNSLAEAEEIELLREQSESFFEETSFESETRSLNLFSYNNGSYSTVEEPTEILDNDRNNITGGAYNTIRNTTLLGANTFATILEQLSSYNSAVTKSVFSEADADTIEISVEDYALLLSETEKRLEEYKSTLTTRLKLFNED